jgi:hypothetical protein
LKVVVNISEHRLEHTLDSRRQNSRTSMAVRRLSGRVKVSPCY